MITAFYWNENNSLSQPGFLDFETRILICQKQIIEKNPPKDYQRCASKACNNLCYNIRGQYFRPTICGHCLGRHVDDACLAFVTRLNLFHGQSFDALYEIAFCVCSNFITCHNTLDIHCDNCTLDYCEDCYVDEEIHPCEELYL